jgi:hypothetical protein
MESPVETFFAGLLARDPSGRSWLPALLRATPHGRERLGDLAADPGPLLISLTVRGASGRLGAFEHPVAPPRALEGWYVDHPEALSWPEDAELTTEAGVLRRALLLDDPPGSRRLAQERAHILMGERSALSREWWRFEERTLLDCALITDRLVVTVQPAAGGPPEPVSAWYPARSRLVRTLEAARLLAEERRWAGLLISEESLPEGSDEQLGRTLPEAAPHLTAAERDELRAAYLGNLTWAAARAATAQL